MGPYSDLHRPGGVDDALPGGVMEHRSVVDAPVLVAPRVTVGVEVHQGEGAMLSRVRPQQGQGDEVVAADGKHRRTRVEDVRRVALDAGGDLIGPAGVHRAVAGVGDREPFRRIEAPRPRRPPRELGGRGADCPWPEARARAVGGREVEGDPGDRHVDAFEVARIRPPEEAERAGVGRFVAQAVGRGAT